MSDDEYPGPSKRRKTEQLDQREKSVHQQLQKYLASKRQLDFHAFPRPSASPRIACFSSNPPPKPFNDSEKKSCVRCKKPFVLKKSGEFDNEEQCVYHYRNCYDYKWSCCGKWHGARGCKTSSTHVHDDNKLDRSGYVATTKKLNSGESPGVYAVDCEMSYTVTGRELTRVSIVDHNYKTVYDEFVKPYGKMLSFNTEHSGITEKDLSGVTITLADVQKFMLDKFSAGTILIGHSLESDFVALRLIHETVVDTSLVFPNPKGLPYKFALRTLARKKLGNLVQVGMHDSVEDASTCMRLMMIRVD